MNERTETEELVSEMDLFDVLDDVMESEEEKSYLPKFSLTVIMEADVE